MGPMTAAAAQARRNWILVDKTAASPVESSSPPISVQGSGIAHYSHHSDTRGGTKSTSIYALPSTSAIYSSSYDKRSDTTLNPGPTATLAGSPSPPLLLSPSSSSSTTNHHPQVHSQRQQPTAGNANGRLHSVNRLNMRLRDARRGGGGGGATKETTTDASAESQQQPAAAAEATGGDEQPTTSTRSTAGGGQQSKRRHYSESGATSKATSFGEADRVVDESFNFIRDEDSSSQRLVKHRNSRGEVDAVYEQKQLQDRVEHNNGNAGGGGDGTSKGAATVFVSGVHVDQPVADHRRHSATTLQRRPGKDEQHEHEHHHHHHEEPVSFAARLRSLTEAAASEQRRRTDGNAIDSEVERRNSNRVRNVQGEHYGNLLPDWKQQQRIVTRSDSTDSLTLPSLDNNNMENRRERRIPVLQHRSTIDSGRQQQLPPPAWSMADGGGRPAMRTTATRHHLTVDDDDDDDDDKKPHLLLDDHHHHHHHHHQWPAAAVAASSSSRQQQQQQQPSRYPYSKQQPQQPTLLRRNHGLYQRCDLCIFEPLRPGQRCHVCGREEAPAPYIHYTGRAPPEVRLADSWATPPQFLQPPLRAHQSHHHRQRQRQSQALLDNSNPTIAAAGAAGQSSAVSYRRAPPVDDDMHILNAATLLRQQRLGHAFPPLATTNGTNNNNNSNNMTLVPPPVVASAHHNTLHYRTLPPPQLVPAANMRKHIYDTRMPPPPPPPPLHHHHHHHHMPVQYATHDWRRRPAQDAAAQPIFYTNKGFLAAQHSMSRPSRSLPRKSTMGPPSPTTGIVYGRQSIPPAWYDYAAWLDRKKRASRHRKVVALVLSMLALALVVSAGVVLAAVNY